MSFQAPLGCESFPTFRAFKTWCTMTCNVNLEVVCSSTRLLTDVTLIPVKKILDYANLGINGSIVLLVWEVYQVCMSQSCFSAMEHLVAVLTLDVQWLLFVNHLDMFSQRPLLTQSLSAMITHVSSIVL